jgi:hypothetical protein
VTVNPPSAPTSASLQREISAAAAALPPLEPVSTLDAVVATVLPLDHPQRNEYMLDELVHAHQEAFVELAYRCLLKRAPDAAGSLDVLQRLAAGDSKIAILGDLRYSTEGRGFAIRVRGLRRRYLFWKLTRLPLLGGIVERLALIAALPQIAREQRRLGQAVAREDRAADAADLAAELRALRDEVAALRTSRERTDGDA